MKTILIAAVDQNLALGVSGNLLFKIPEDLKLFKRLTIGHIVLMGRKTFESLGCKPLPDRVNIVISKTKKYENDGVITFESLTTAVEYSKQKFPDKDLYVVGGGRVYEESLKYADEVILTRYDRAYEDVDTYFPAVPETEFREEKTLLEGSFEDCKYRTIVLHRVI